MKSPTEKEPKDKTSYQYFEWLRRENARQLRKAGHRAPKINERVRKSSKKFNKISDHDGSIRQIDSTKDYQEWLEYDALMDEDGNPVEPLEANPDSFEGEK